MGDERRALTVFGAVVLELMLGRGIRTWVELSALFREHGYDFKAPRMGSWSYGRHPADKLFPSALAEVLGLNSGERTRLAHAFTYGQDIEVSGPESWRSSAGDL